MIRLDTALLGEIDAYALNADGECNDSCFSYLSYGFMSSSLLLD